MERGTTKLCTRCQQRLSTDFFSPRGKDRPGVQAWCKKCMSEWGRASRRAALGLRVDEPLPRRLLPDGTTYAHRGYTLERRRGHHRSDASGYVFQHILVAEEKYGFPITRDFTIHHRNGDRGDNRPENLELRYGNHGKGADVLDALLRVPDMRRRAVELLREYGEVV